MRLGEFLIIAAIFLNLFPLNSCHFLWKYLLRQLKCWPFIYYLLFPNHLCIRLVTQCLAEIFFVFYLRLSFAFRLHQSMCVWVFEWNRNAPNEQNACACDNGVFLPVSPRDDIIATILMLQPVTMVSLLLSFILLICLSIHNRHTIWSAYHPFMPCIESAFISPFVCWFTNNRHIKFE